MYFPINYLRNIGIHESWTSHTVFVDVDLIPGGHVYQNIKNYLQSNYSNKSNKRTVSGNTLDIEINLI